MLVDVADEATAGQFLCRVRRSYVEALAAIFAVPRRDRTGRATGDGNRLLLVRHKPNINGAPDLRAKSVDDHVLNNNRYSGMVYAYAVVRLLLDSLPSLKDPYGLSGDLNGQVYSDGTAPACLCYAV